MSRHRADVAANSAAPTTHPVGGTEHGSSDLNRTTRTAPKTRCWP